MTKEEYEKIKRETRLHAWGLARDKIENLAEAFDAENEQQALEELIVVLAIILSTHIEEPPAIVLGMLAGHMMEAEMKAMDAMQGLQQFLQHYGGSPN